MIRWLGAAFIIGSCGSCGIAMAMAQLREEGIVKELLRFLSGIRWELEYRMTPLPDLVENGAKVTHGALRCVLLRFMENLRNLSLPDAGSCMALALDASLPMNVIPLLRLLGDSLGRYDLSGQLEGLLGVEASCRDRLSELKQERGMKVHSCRILGFCAGIALAVLLV